MSSGYCTKLGTEHCSIIRIVLCGTTFTLLKKRCQCFVDAPMLRSHRRQRPLTDNKEKPQPHWLRDAPRRTQKFATFFLGTNCGATIRTYSGSAKAGHRSTLRSSVFAFWHRASVYVRFSAFCLRIYATTKVRPVCVYVFENNACVRK